MIKKYIASVILLALMTAAPILGKKAAIAYRSGDIIRFGDQIVIYAKAKWLALHNDLELYYWPFKESEKLVLSKYETLWEPSVATKNRRKRGIFSENDITTKFEPILYVSDLLTYIPSISNYSLSKSSSPGDTNINDICEEVLVNSQFGAEMKKMLQPITPLEPLNLPSDKITVAIHVRRPSRHDGPLLSEQFYDQQDDLTPTTMPKSKRYFDTIHPFKFPPLQFYTDQLLLLSSLLDDAPIYAYLFTDDKNPKKLQEIFEEKCNKSNITFDCRHDENQWDRNIVEDIWAMSQFDCLIRSWSHFSGTAQMLGNHKIIIYPRTCFWSGNKLIMNEIFFIIRNPETNNLCTFTLPLDDLDKLKSAAAIIMFNTHNNDLERGL